LPVLTLEASKADSTMTRSGASRDRHNFLYGPCRQLTGRDEADQEIIVSRDGPLAATISVWAAL
jgi:hypothetical protein